jgi:hypothetical protein
MHESCSMTQQNSLIQYDSSSRLGVMDRETGKERNLTTSLPRIPKKNKNYF